MLSQATPPKCDWHTRSRVVADIVLACENNDIHRLKQIFDYAGGFSHGPDEFMAHWVDCYDHRGFNPLMTAVHNGAHETTEMLLTGLPRPARVVAGHVNGTTAAHVAAYTSNLIALQLMAEHAHPFDWGNAVRWQDRWGKLPLHHAHFHRFQEGVDLLAPISPAGVRDSGGRLPEEQEPGQPLRRALEPENGVGEDPPGGGAAEAPAE